MVELGIQLHSVRNNMAADPIKTIKKIAKTGYKTVEIARHDANEEHCLGFGLSANKINILKKESGINIIGAHINPINKKNIRKMAEFYKEIGTKYIIISLDFFKDKREVANKAGKYDELGKVLHDYGMQLLYHNHFHEFQIIDGKPVIDWIYELTNPEYVGFELDTYWVFRSGNNPISVLKRLGNRIKLIHQKDMPAGYGNGIDLLDKSKKHGGVPTCLESFVSYINESAFTEIGTGIMSIQSIINTAIKYTAAEHLILDQDFTKLDEMKSMKINYNNLSEYEGIQIPST
jgi:sugar phosphate isomerase/epimerase